MTASITRSENDLNIRLIGAFELRSAQGVHAMAKRKTAAILAYLLLGNQTRETRGRLAALLWSESDEEHARASLRQCVRDLRQIEELAGTSFLLIDKLSVGASLDAFKTDASALDLAISTAAYPLAQTMLSNAKDGLCANLYECDPVFDNWLWMQSTAWQDGTIAKLADAMKTAKPAQRKTIAACLLQLDPFFEPAVLETLRGLHQDGGFARARSYFERYAEELRAELDLSPSPDITREMARLKDSATAGPVGSGDGSNVPPDTALGLPKPTIIIITSKSATEDSHIQLALASELSASLSRFRHWTAIQVERDRPPGRTISLDEMRATTGEHADLAVLIQRKAGGIDPLYEVSCYDFLEGERQFMMNIVADSSSWKSAANELCAQVSARLQIAISSTRLHRVRKMSPNQISAYDCWLDGQRLSIMWQKDTEKAAVERYEEAIALDPQLTCAYSSLAAVLNSRWIVFPGSPSDAQDRERAFELAKKSVLLDPFDHRNQVNLAWSHLLAHRWDLAEFHFDLAHDLNASNPATLIANALAKSYLGDHERAAELSRRSFQLNPLSDPHYHGYQATISFLGGDFRGCVEAAAKARDLFPDLQGWSAAANALLGNHALAHAEYLEFCDRLARAWHNSDKPDETQAIAWFKNAFPIRRAADRALLAKGIDEAAAG